jgi:hypothetical protein
MELIRSEGDRKIWLAGYQDRDVVSFPFDGKAFVCIVWNNREGFTSRSLVEMLLKANCKYFLAGGYESDAWEYLADEIHLSLYPDFGPPASEHVMTTSHKDEPLEEVIWFAWNNTNFDHHDFKNFGLIQAGQGYSKDEILRMIDKALT